MKFINSFCGTVAVFVVLLVTAYSGIAVGNNYVEELYSVKINNIPLRRDVAEGVLLRINGNYKHEGITSYSNVQSECTLDSKTFNGKTRRRIRIDINDNGVVSYLAVF